MNAREVLRSALLKCHSFGAGLLPELPASVGVVLAISRLAHEYLQYNPGYNDHAYNDILVIAIFFRAPIHFSYNERYYDISLSLPSLMNYEGHRSGEYSRREQNF